MTAPIFRDVAKRDEGGVSCAGGANPHFSRKGRARNGVPGIFHIDIFLFHLLGGLMNRLLRQVQVGGLVLGSVMVLTAADTATLPAPPVAKKGSHVSEGNAYTEAVMKPTEGFQKKLYAEMLGRIKETDVEVPYREGEYFYYVRTEAGKQYGIRCRRKSSMDAPEEVLLDINELAKGQAFMSVAAFAVSPCCFF